MIRLIRRYFGPAPAAARAETFVEAQIDLRDAQIEALKKENAALRQRLQLAGLSEWYARGTAARRRQCDEPTVVVHRSSIRRPAPTEQIGGRR